MYYLSSNMIFSLTPFCLRRVLRCTQQNCPRKIRRMEKRQPIKNNKDNLRNMKVSSCSTRGCVGFFCCTITSRAKFMFVLKVQIVKRVDIQL
uniref:Uncharacterized protein n=1 Tax=Rhipicephalus appendiculatus TaxID=34631 RepID=A0A131YE89_RHIAP